MVSRLAEKMGFNGFGRGRPRQVVGVDIGTTSLKVCLIDKAKEGGLALSGLGCRFYDHELLHDGNVIDRLFVANEIRHILGSSAIKTKWAASALSSYSVITKRMSMPLLDEEALENAVRLEVESIIPFPLNEIYYSYSVMGPDEEKEKMISLLIVAAKKEIVDDYVETFEAAGLSLSVLDVDILAVTNLIEEIYEPTGDSILAADIGASVTSMAVVKGPNLEFTKEIRIGGNYVTRELAKSQNLTYKEAEEKKLRAEDGAAALLQDFVSNVAAEIHKTVNFYAATKPRATVGRIYLTGGSSAAPGIRESIEKATGIKVEFLNPFLCLPEGQGTDEKLAPFMPVALYLAKRGSEGTL